MAFMVYRDGEPVSGERHETWSLALGELLRVQPNSALHACEHEGYEIREV